MTARTHKYDPIIMLKMRLISVLSKKNIHISKYDIENMAQNMKKVVFEIEGSLFLTEGAADHI